MASKPRVAFAGLGAMGYGMASQLLQSSFPVIGYDPYQPSLDCIAAEGAIIANTPKDAAKGVGFFICMVANHHQANRLLFNPETGALTLLKFANDEIGSSDVGLIDCPVSGGAARAADGTLSIFASGKDTHIKAAKPILSCMSDKGKLYNIGALGGGSKAKLVHQIFAGINIAMASEAMGLAAKAGFNTRKAFEELNQGLSQSWIFGNRVPHMLDPTLPRYSAMAIIVKDVGIITSTSRECNFLLPLLSTSAQLYQQAISSGYTTEDDCVLVRLYIPTQHDLVHERVNADQTTDKPQVSVDDIKDLMIAVHLAATSEAMSFCERLGIEADLMYDIVVNAAGASAAFEKYFQAMKKAHWSLKGIPEVQTIRNALAASIEKTFDLRYPLFLSSAALQEFHRQLD